MIPRSIDIESSSSDENDGEEVSAGLVTAFNNVNASVLNINGSINNPNDKHDVMRLNSVNNCLTKLAFMYWKQLKYLILFDLRRKRDFSSILRNPIRCFHTKKS